LKLRIRDLHCAEARRSDPAAHHRGKRKNKASKQGTVPAEGRAKSSISGKKKTWRKGLDVKASRGQYLADLRDWERTLALKSN